MTITVKCFIVGAMSILLLGNDMAYATPRGGGSNRLADALPHTLRFKNQLSQAPPVDVDFDKSLTVSEHSPHPDRLVIYTNLAGIGFVTIWGVWNWDYFTRSPHARSEGWFGHNTSSGGADKVGHFYSSYAASHAFSWFYRSNGMSHSNAAFYGAMSSFIVMGYMEFGDSFSRYGFSYEDMVANAFGCLSGYFLYKHPELSQRLDIRVEVGLHPESTDIITDYDNLKFLLAFKLNGFESTRRSMLKYIELHVGYYTRGYEYDGAERERNLYVGIGLNLTDMFRKRGHKGTATVLNYIQPPYTSLNYRYDVN